MREGVMGSLGAGPADLPGTVGMLILFSKEAGGGGGIRRLLKPYEFLLSPSV